MIVCRFSSLDKIYVKPMKKKLVRLTGTRLVKTSKIVCDKQSILTH